MPDRPIGRREFVESLVIDFGATDDPDFGGGGKCACLTAHRFPGEAGGVGTGENPVLSSGEGMLREGIPGFASHQDNIFLIFSSSVCQGFAGQNTYQIIWVKYIRTILKK